MKYCAWLHSTGVIGAGAYHRMRDKGMSAQSVWETDNEIIKKTGVFTDTQLNHIAAAKSGKTPDEIWEELTDKGILFYCMGKGEYPQKLLNIPNAPYGLFVKGALPDPDIPCVGIVGARNCTNYGFTISYEIGRKLADKGIGVISGLARGIDSRSQQGALDAGGLTYGVLGSGIDVCYPPENSSLYERICQKGGMISEFSPGTKPQGKNFPMRNRIISGFCDALIVVEARKRSGSLITADFALDQGRDVYAVPGPLDNENSKGTNYLIKQGAGIFLSVEDMLEDLSRGGIFADYLSVNPPLSKELKNHTAQKLILADFERVVYSSLTLCPKGLDILMEETGLELKELYRAIFCLVRSGYIKEVSKNKYARVKA